MMWNKDIYKMIFGVSIFYLIYFFVFKKSIITTKSFTTGETSTNESDSLFDKIIKDIKDEK